MDALRKPEVLSPQNSGRVTSNRFDAPPAQHKRDFMRPSVWHTGIDDPQKAPDDPWITDMVFSVFVGLVAWLALIWAIRAAVSVLI